MDISSFGNPWIKRCKKKLVIAGGFPSAQLEYNMFSRYADYNDIDFWYDDHNDGSVDDTWLLKAAGE